jgi:HAD superfamily hydrolase (TIGR01509 family)
VSAAPIRAVLFDFDGTLTRPEAIDFPALRQRLGCPPGMPILEYLDGLPSPAERARLLQILEDFEAAAARASMPNTGAEETLAELSRRGLLLGISSRNSRASIGTALANFRSTRVSDFRVVLSREDTARQKPHPDAALAAAARMGVAPAEMLVVGDYVFDVAAGHTAGCPTAYLTNGGPAPVMEPPPDHVIAVLAELPAIVAGRAAHV